MSLPNPYFLPLQSNADKGFYVGVRGKFNSDNAASINLAADRQLENVAFHVSIRPSENTVVFNNKKDGEWQKENRHSLKVSEGDEISVSILADDDEYDVYINGDKYHSFDYRVPVGTVNVVQVQGGMDIESVVASQQITNLPHEQLSVNWDRLHIAGKTKSDFAINVKDQADNILMHINPRFGPGQCVLNSYKDGNWGEEVRAGGFPFKKGDIFDIEVQDIGQTYKVTLNNKDQVSFNKRWPAVAAKIFVNGDDLNLYACQAVNKNTMMMGGGMGGGGVNVQVIHGGPGGMIGGGGPGGMMGGGGSGFGFGGHNPGPFGHGGPGHHGPGQPGWRH